MALVTVNLIDTFDEWRIKTNSIGSNTGDLTTLVTTDKSSIVAAINEIHTDDSDDMEHLIDDTTPQLGGHLDIQAFNITGTGSIAGNITDAISVGGVVTGTIGNIQIPDNAITSNMIGPGVIVASDIAVNAVDGTHIAMGSDVAGDILYYDGTDYVRLAKGTAAQVLAINAGATAPEWTDVASGGGGASESFAVGMAIALG